jgi:uncharacterized protein
MSVELLGLINQDAAVFSTNALIIIAIIVYGAILARIVPQKSHLPINIAATLITVGLGLLIGLSLADMGFGNFIKGAVIGGGLSLIIIVGTFIVSFIPPVRRIFIAENHAKVKKGRLIFEAAVRIPLGTALVEETLFRGLLLGVLLVSYSTPVALVVSSVIFGLWHILPTIDSLAKNDEALKILGTRKRWHFAGIFGVVVITSIAGAFFSYLRIISGSILAPWLVHWAINSSGAIAASAQAAIGRKTK